MTTNFEKPASCRPFLGARRYAPFAPPELKKENEECYAEKTYEEKINYELQESNAKLEALKKLEEEIKKEGNNKVALDYRFNRPSHLFSRVSISSEGVKTITDFNRIEDFYTINNPTGQDLEDATSKSETPETIDGIPKSLYELGVRSRRHPRTIRKYIAILLAFFSNLETEYVDENGTIFVKKLPVFYANREKLISIKEHEFKELTNGNTNSIPRASFVLDSIEYDSDRQLNKNVPVSSNLTMHALAQDKPYAEVSYAPSPYNINCRMNILTRGMDDALMLAEQIGSFFNPFFALEITENEAGNESQVKIKLEGMTFEPIETEEYSQNEVLTEISFTLYGNLFRPVKREQLINKINISYGIS